MSGSCGPDTRRVRDQTRGDGNEASVRDARACLVALAAVHAGRQGAKVRVLGYQGPGTNPNSTPPLWPISQGGRWFKT